MPGPLHPPGSLPAQMYGYGSSPAIPIRVLEGEIPVVLMGGPYKRLAKEEIRPLSSKIYLKISICERFIVSLNFPGILDVKMGPRK